MRIGFLAFIFVSLICRLASANKQIQLEDCHIDYREHAGQPSGEILLAPYRLGDKHGIAHLVVLKADGEVAFHRPFEHYFKPMFLGDFKVVEPGYLGYFISSSEHGRWSSKYYFLDLDFQDVFLHPVPNYDPSLDGRWSMRRPGGGYFFLFSRKRAKAQGATSSEIDEVDIKGNTPFSWNAEDYLDLPRDRQGSLDVSAVAWEQDGFLVGLEKGEVVKVAYPQGKAVWRLWHQDWKFVGDPEGGFTKAEALTALPDGNILLIDRRASGQERAVEYRLDAPSRVATMVWQFAGPEHSPARGGSVQRLKNGDTLVAWGGSTVVEVTPSGDRSREWVLSNGYSTPSAQILEK
jgi:hypothetical protein